MLTIFDISLFIGLGVVTGILAGLFGLGGGTLIVPGLFYLFSIIDIPSESSIRLAIGTSLCIMIFTSASSMWVHQSKGNIQWDIAKKMIATILIGAVVGRILSDRIPTELLKIGFGIFLVLVSIKIAIGFKPNPSEDSQPGTIVKNIVGLIIGLKSGILGVGGGTISVPFFLYSGLPIKQASGTSSSLSLPISIIGTLALLIFNHDTLHIPLSIGYIYLPAVVLVAPFTMIGAPIGANLAQIVPADKLRISFALCLLLLSLKMLPLNGTLTLAVVDWLKSFS